ncbi:MAG: hypothetical protein AAGF94_18125 [Pseudomonadota bacterium]
MTKQIPMLFSGPMMQAHLKGLKTETRRVLTQNNSLFNGGPWTKLDKAQEWDWDGAWIDPGPSPVGNPGPYLKLPWKHGPNEDVFEETVHRIYPRVQAGDLIWAKERWRVGAWHYANADIAVDFEDGPLKEWRHVEDGDILCRLIEQSRQDAANSKVALNDMTYWEYTWSPGTGPCRWRPSLHMPKWANRLTLRVTEVRIERLQDITMEAAVREGCPGWVQHDMQDGLTPVEDYREIWEHINGPGSWVKNPWVIVHRYEPIWKNVLEVAEGRSCGCT